MAPADRLTPGPHRHGADPGRRRAPRRVRWTGAALLMLVLLEIIGIITVSRWIGGGWTFLALVGAVVLGLAVVARAGAKAWRALRQDAVEGIVPGRDVGDPVLLLVAGLLLIAPGFISDLCGLVLMLPPTRSVARALFRAAFGWRVPPGVKAGEPVPGMEHFRPPGGGEHVVPGEVVDPDPDDDDRR